MEDSGEENIERPEGAEGGSSSSDEVETELVEEEEPIDTSWEASEVHPKRERPRIGFGRIGTHPNVSPPRVYLTDRSSSASPSRGVQTEEFSQEQAEQERPPEEGAQASASNAPEQQPKEKVPLKRRISERLQRMRFLKSSGDSPDKPKKTGKKD